MPALAQGNWVLSDRFSDASYAYQQRFYKITNLVKNGVLMIIH
jgi:thymidylate kinase